MGDGLLRRAPALLALLCAVLAAGTVHAAKPKFHATGSFMVSYSDNILSAPDQPPPNLPDVAPPVADVGVQFAPGVAMFYDTPRVQLAVSYSHPMLLYVEHPLANAVGNSLALLGLFSASPFDELTTRFTIDHTTSGLSNLTTPASESEARVRPLDDNSMVGINLVQTYFRSLSPRWSLVSAGSAGVSIPVEGGSSMFAGTLSAGPELRLTNHSFGVAPTFAYSRPLGDETSIAGFNTVEQIVVGGEGRWSWDWNTMWSSQTSIGVVAPIQENVETDVRPVGSAAIRFSSDGGYGASIGYARGYVPDLLTGQTFFSDTISFHSNLPIYAKERILLQSSAGFGFNRAIDSVRQIDTDVVKTTTVDASVGWHPVLYPHISLRYQYIKQFGAAPDQIVLPNFDRHMVGFDVTYVFPPRIEDPQERERNRVDSRDGPSEGDVIRERRRESSTGGSE